MKSLITVGIICALLTTVDSYHDADILATLVKTILSLFRMNQGGGCFDVIPCTTITGKKCVPEYKLLDANNPGKYISFVGCTNYGTKLGPSCAISVDDQGMATIFEECDPACRAIEIQTSYLNDAGGCQFGFIYKSFYFGACTSLDNSDGQLWCPTALTHPDSHRLYTPWNKLLNQWQPCPKFCNESVKVPGFKGQNMPVVSPPATMMPSPMPISPPPVATPTPPPMMPAPAPVTPAPMMPAPVPMMPAPVPMMPAPSMSIPMTSTGKYDRCFPQAATM